MDSTIFQNNTVESRATARKLFWAEILRRSLVWCEAQSQLTICIGRDYSALSQWQRSPTIRDTDQIKSRRLIRQLLHKVLPIPRSAIGVCASRNLNTQNNPAEMR